MFRIFQIVLLKMQGEKNKILTILLLMLLCQPSGICQRWRFAVVADTHVGASDTVAEMIPYLLADSIDCGLFPGDIADGGLAATESELSSQITHWLSIMQPLYDEGIGVYPVYGNHEDDAHNNLTVWNSIFSGAYALPQNGPSGEMNLTYSVSHKNALFIGLDTYQNIHIINQEWLNEQLALNTAPHIFVFGHEAAFKVFHEDCLDDSASARNTFWESLSQAGVKTYFCGHDHFLDVAKIDDGDENEENDVYQYLVGTGGGWLMSQFSNYNGENTPYIPERIFHEMEYGYALVEISGSGADDTQVTITWKKRVWNATTSSNEYIATSDVIQYSVKSTTTGIYYEDEKEGLLYPNPAMDFINVSGLDGLTKIYNLAGVEVWSGIINGSKQLDLSTFQDGIYLIQNEHLHSKFIVAK